MSDSNNFQLNSMPINITDCEELEKILLELYKANNHEYGDEEYGITDNSSVALRHAQKFTAAVKKMIKFPSKRNIIHCHRQLSQLRLWTDTITITKKRI